MTEQKRIVIVGGVAGGASAATRARRLSEDARIVLFERGEHISFANCGMPYHIGGAIPSRERLLVQTVEGMRRRYRIDVRTQTEVLRIDRQRQEVAVRNLATGEESSEPYDVLILSPGAEPVRPPIEGVESDKVLSLRSLADMDAIKRVVDEDRPAHAVVVGGGYIGLEMTEALRERGLEVTLVELAEQVFLAADPEMVTPIHQEIERCGVDLRLATSVESIRAGGARLHVGLSSGESLETGLVILAVGVRPETKLAREAGLDLGATGGILVDEAMRTSDPNIFAVGDAVEVTHLVGGTKSLIPLAGPANRQGRIAADNALGRASVYRHTQGTAICKVFGLAIGMTGMSERGLKRVRTDYEKIYVHPASHAGYYPGAKQMSLKLLFSPADGTILGAQAVGADGIDKRIDVLAVAIRGKMTVHDLKDLELSYAPPYGSAKDPVNYAGFVASNVLDGDVAVCHVEDVLRPTDNQLLLDVSTPVEFEAGTVPGAKNVPIDDLRERFDELPRDKEILAFCRVGLRGYLACRILQQHGYACRNLTGGYKTFAAAVGTMPKRDAAKVDGVTSGAASTCQADSASTAAASSPDEVPVVKTVDACALRCPGPIMKLKEELEKVDRGQAIAIAASDSGFPHDVAGWCNSTGHRLLGVKSDGGAYVATVARNGKPLVSPAQTNGAPSAARNKSIVVFSGDFDKAMAAFIIANGAAAMGSTVTMFFTFWGLNVLRRPEKVKTAKSLVERMFGWMMPRGANKLGLSTMNMGGMGLKMIKGIMRKKNVSSLPELIASARRAGVRLIACTMSMDLMGLRREELIEGVEEGGVAMYLDRAESGNVNLFI